MFYSGVTLPLLMRCRSAAVLALVLFGTVAGLRLFMRRLTYAWTVTWSILHLT